MIKQSHTPWRLSLLLACAAGLTACNTAPPSTVRNTSLNPYPENARRPYPEDAANHRYDRDENNRYGRDMDDRDNGYNRDREGERGTRSERRPSNHAAADSTPGHFDYFLLDLSWSPEYCFSHRDAPECTTHSAFVLHGLWPQNTDGTYPENCSDAPGPSNPSQYSDLYPNAGLLNHEWREHGTCSGLSATQYLSEVGTAYHALKIPPTLAHLTQQTNMSPDQVLGLFTQVNTNLPRTSLALSCGHNYLTAIGVCLDKQLHATSCGQLRSCSAGTIRITPPAS